MREKSVSAIVQQFMNSFSDQEKADLIEADDDFLDVLEIREKRRRRKNVQNSKKQPNNPSMG